VLVPVELRRARLELCCDAGGLRPGSVELRGLAVELRLAGLDVRSQALELLRARFQVGEALFEIGLAALDPRLAAGKVRLLPLLVGLQELPLGEAPAQRIEAVLAVPTSFELPRDSSHPLLELLFALRQLALALGHLASGLAELLLGVGEIVERFRASAPPLFDHPAIERFRGLWRSGGSGLPSHHPGSSIAADRMGHRHGEPVVGMKVRVWIALGTIYVVWGSTFLAIAVTVRDLPPFLSMGLRHLVAGSVLFAWVWWRRRGKLEIGRREWGAAFIFGGLLFLAGHGGLAWAQQDVPSGVAALLVGTIPLWFAVLAWIALGERLGRRALIGLVLGFAGLALLVDPSGHEGAKPLGALVIAFGAFSWAAGSIWSRRLPLPRDTLLSAAMGMLAGGTLLALVSGLSGELDDAHFTPEALGAIAYMVVVGSLIGFSAYVWLLKVAPASTVSTYAYVNPVIAVLLGWAFNDEVITSRTLVAGAAIVVGVALMVSRPGQREEAPAAEPALAEK
jgi:drug/metabolite transporter (DMT)-like permease